MNGCWRSWTRRKGNVTTVILALDIGNTNMEFGLFEGRELRFSFRLGTNRDATSDGLP